jgi:hypothetical protein
MRINKGYLQIRSSAESHPPERFSRHRIAFSLRAASRKERKKRREKLARRNCNVQSNNQKSEA